MKKIKTSLAILFPLFIFCMSACQKSVDQGIKDNDRKKLAEQLEKIKQLADQPCTDPKDWTFTAYGAKACGGPIGYLAYPTTIDTTAFKKLVLAYGEAEKEFNKKYNIMSDCMYLMPPTSIQCENGIAKLIWDKNSL